MKIKFQQLDLCLAHEWKTARSHDTKIAKTIALELINIEGIIGFGEAAPILRYHESIQTVESFLRKLDSSKLSFDDIAGSTAYLDSLSSADVSAKCAVNLALLDGAAKKARRPVFDFLGLGFREKQHVTSFTISIDKPEIIRAKVQAAEQYPVLKMKVGVAEDQANLRALREVAPTRLVRVDANEGWKTKEQALQMIEWLAKDAHIQFVEQPMPAAMPVKDWVWLKQRSPLPIFGDESYHHAGDVEQAAECFHGVNVKLVKTGGIIPAFHALQTARNLGLKTMLGCMVESSILISAAAHLAELCDHLDLDGNLLITNDPYLGVTAEKGILSFAQATEPFGLRVSAKRQTL